MNDNLDGNTAALASVAADRELGRVIRVLVTDYIVSAQDSI